MTKIGTEFSAVIATAHCPDGTASNARFNHVGSDMEYVFRAALPWILPTSGVHWLDVQVQHLTDERATVRVKDSDELAFQMLTWLAPGRGVLLVPDSSLSDGYRVQVTHSESHERAAQARLAVLYRGYSGRHVFSTIEVNE